MEQGGGSVSRKDSSRLESHLQGQGTLGYIVKRFRSSPRGDRKPQQREEHLSAVSVPYFNKTALYWSLHGAGLCHWIGVQLILCQDSHTCQVGTLEFMQVNRAISIHQAREV